MACGVSWSAGGSVALAACGGNGGPPRLDRAALAVADSYTRLAFDQHDCRAASRYSFGSGSLCRGGLSAADSFPLTSGRITRKCGGFTSSSNTSSVSPGCIVYTATNGDTVTYFMTKKPGGWRIADFGTLGTGTLSGP